MQPADRQQLQAKPLSGSFKRFWSRKKAVGPESHGSNNGADNSGRVVARSGATRVLQTWLWKEQNSSVYAWIAADAAAVQPSWQLPASIFSPALTSIDSNLTVSGDTD